MSLTAAEQAELDELEALELAELSSRNQRRNQAGQNAARASVEAEEELRPKSFGESLASAVMGVGEAGGGRAHREETSSLGLDFSRFLPAGAPGGLKTAADAIGTAGGAALRLTPMGALATQAAPLLNPQGRQRGGMAFDEAQEQDPTAFEAGLRGGQAASAPGAARALVGIGKSAAAAVPGLRFRAARSSPDTQAKALELIPGVGKPLGFARRAIAAEPPGPAADYRAMLNEQMAAPVASAPVAGPAGGVRPTATPPSPAPAKPLPPRVPTAEEFIRGAPPPGHGSSQPGPRLGENPPDFRAIFGNRPGASELVRAVDDFRAASGASPVAPSATSTWGPPAPQAFPVVGQPAGASPPTLQLTPPTGPAPALSPQQAQLALARGQVPPSSSAMAPAPSPSPSPSPSPMDPAAAQLALRRGQVPPPEMMPPGEITRQMQARAGGAPLELPSGPAAPPPSARPQRAAPPPDVVEGVAQNAGVGVGPQAQRQAAGMLAGKADKALVAKLARNVPRESYARADWLKGIAKREGPDVANAVAKELGMPGLGGGIPKPKPKSKAKR